jgi:hypothetical protein
MVTQVGQVTTIGFPRWSAIVLTVVLVPVALVLGATAAALAWYCVPVLARHATLAAALGYFGGYFALLVIATAWVAKRMWGRAVCFDDEGVTIRDVWRTRRYRWQDVSHFTDGHRASPSPLDWDPEVGGPVRWALAILLRDGQVIIVSATSYRGPRASHEMLAEIRQVARRHRIRGSLTGDPHNFRWAP